MTASPLSILSGLEGLIRGMSTLQTRALEAIAAGYKNGELARGAGVSTGAVSQWLSGDTKSLKPDTAFRLQSLTGWSAEWWATGKGPKIPQREVSPTRDRGGVNEPPGKWVSHDLRHQTFDTPETLTWESIVAMKGLPPRFCLAVPDDALTPRTPRGTVLIFETGARPGPGDGVLVEDRHGGRHVRRYLPGLAGAWSAGVHNDAYPRLESERDGLVLIAAATGRMSGSV